MLLRSRLTSVAPLAVTCTMIGCDDDERLVVCPYFAQTPNQITEETVREPDLRQMSLVERIGVGPRSRPSNNPFPRYILVW